jgi:hypothetical protein
MAVERNQEIKGRYLHRDEAGVKALSDAQIAELNKKFNLTEDLGIPVNGDGNPATFSTQGYPRVFFTSPMNNMADSARSAEEANIKIGSKEFWRQVQLGNVFVYPAGQTGPSQLQVSDPAKGEPSVSISSEIKSANKMPERKIKAPGFFKRAFSFLSSKWREQVKSYDNQQYSNYGLLVDSHLSRRSSDVLKNEVTDMEHFRKRKEKEAWQKEHSANYEKVQNKNADTLVHDDNVDRLFKLKPEPKESWVIEDVVDKETGEISKSSGHAEKEVFQKLKPIDLNMEKITSQHLKKPFTEEDFTTMAFYTTTEKEIQKKASAAKQDKSFAAEASVLEKCGVSKEDAEFLALDQGANAAFSDYYGQDPRPGTGNTSIPHMIQPAREKTQEAFEAYGRGDKTKLAYLVANAVKRAAFEHCRMDVPKGAKTFGDKSDAGMALQTAKLAELINKDPQLLDIAKKQYGMKDEDLKLVNGMAEYKKLTDARTAAQRKLTLAEKNNEPLSEAEKKQCIKDIVKADLATQMIASQKAELAENKENQELSNAIMATGKDPGGTLDPLTQQMVLNPQPEGTMITMSAANYAFFKVPALLNKRPGFVQGLKADSPNLDLAAEQVMAQDKLYKEGMSEQEAFEKIDNHMYSAESMTKASAAMKAKNAPQAQKEMNGPDIDQRKNMFEPKKNEGPQVPTV